MSLYNTLFGVNPATPILMASLGLDNQAPENWEEKYQEICDSWGEPDIYSEKGQALMKEATEVGYYPTGRFRDIYFEHEEGKEPKIVLYTRNGGGNRDWYEYVFELLSNHPLYIQNYDDDFDCTYAYIEFSAPESVVKFFDGIKTGKLPNVSEKFKAEIEAMEDGKEPNAAIVQIIENIVKDLK
jgi:hypothetical protein